MTRQWFMPVVTDAMLRPLTDQEAKVRGVPPCVIWRWLSARQWFTQEALWAQAAERRN
jgi:hypothetical protein